MNNMKSILLNFKKQSNCPNIITHKLKFFFCSSENIQKWKNFQNPRMKKMKENNSNKDNYEDNEITKEKRLLREKEQKLLKDYESYKEIQNQQLKDVPPNLVIKNLHYPQTNTEVILLGVEKRNSMHASFVHDCLVNLKPELVTTQIAPDMPYFIRTKLQFQEAWNRFVKGKFDYKFYVNPQPTSLYDIMLNSESINQLVSGGILNSQDIFEVGSLFIYTQNHISKEFEVDTYLTPLLYLYNNPHQNCNLIVNDYPYIKYRDNINRFIDIQELKDIFNQFKQVVEEQGTKTMFDPLLLKPEIFIYPKVAYITESIRNSCYTSKKVLSIVDRHMTDEIENYWKTLSKQPQNLNLFMKDEFFKKHLDQSKQQIEERQNLKGQSPIITEQGVEGYFAEEKDTFIEYVEKHVILDLMLDPLIREYFIKNRVFPYIGKQYTGHKTMIQQIFVMLDHYYHQHNKSTRERDVRSFEEHIAHGTPNETK